MSYQPVIAIVVCDTSNCALLCRSVETYNEEQFASIASTMIKHVARMLSVTLEQAGSMLGVFHWDAQALIDAFLEGPDAVAKRCGVSLTDAGALSLQRYALGRERSNTAASRPTAHRFQQFMMVQVGHSSRPPPTHRVNCEPFHFAGRSRFS